MVCLSDRQYLHHSLQPAIIDFLSQIDENFYQYLNQKNLDVPFWQICQYLILCSLPVLYCHHCCAVLSCTAMPVCNLCCVDEILSQFVSPQNVKIVLIWGKISRTLSYIKDAQLNIPGMFQIKIDYNTNLILIWPHRHFQKNVKVPFCQKYQC